jgi:hypothetical protein
MTYSLIMVTYVNNANPVEMVHTSQTVIGNNYPTEDACKAAAHAVKGLNPAKTNLDLNIDMLRVYFVWVQNG